MEPALAYRLGADALLLLHGLFVAFVVCGLLLVLVGGWRGWGWVRNVWFRSAHLAAIGYVTLQAWLGAICPLTIWEMQLRERAGEATYAGAFVAHWVERLLYYRAPDWVFVLLYTVFAGLVVASWLWVRPRRFGGKRG